MDSRTIIAYMAYKSLSAAERDQATDYAGPDHSFPLYSDGKHLAAAWDLAGQADDPEAVRRKILDFARAHNLMDHLPLSAQHMANVSAITKKAYSDAPEEVPEGQGLLVEKAMPIMKAWTDQAGVTHIEGWISTPDRDLDKDSVEPEAFAKAIDGYFALGAPLTSDHHMKPDPDKGIMVRYPVGHLQSAALVRDGNIFKSANHPSDPADFEHFPQNGTGVYARAVLTDELASSQVSKGNVRGFSWVGIVRTVDKLPGGRWKFLSVDPWRESTIAAFPVNTKAVLVAAN